MIRTTVGPLPQSPGRSVDTCHAPDRGRVRAAAERALAVYPGPVGETLADVLEQWAEFGYRFGAGSRMGALVEKIEAKEKAT